MKRNLYAGIDVGSSSVRVGLLDDNGVLIDTYSEPITYYVNKENPSFVTQSSDEVWNATLKCLGILKNSIKESGYELVSVGCCATCSMVVMRNTTDGLVPYPVNYASDDENQNIVFWMDRRAQEQADFINNKLKHDKVLDKQGGAFIAEMGIPKVKYLIEHIPKEDIDDIVFFDLHDFISYKLGGSKTNNNFEINISNTKSQIALDGELKGWSSRFFKLIGLEQLAKDNFKAIGRVERNSNYTGFLGVPLAGTKIGKHENCTIGHGVIDSYGSWLASSGKSIEGTLTMVAGTSTCFIIGHTSNETVPGIWGPFEGIFSEYLVSTAGQSATGLLFQRLFESHPAFTQIQNHTGDDVFEIIEDKIKTIELETEFLAFQTRQTTELMSNYSIKKILLCGSQAKNLRFIKLLATVTKTPVEVSDTLPELAGVRGASYLGYSAYHNVNLAEVIYKFNDKGTIFRNESLDLKLNRLPDQKYYIMKDIAETQRRYNRLVESAISI